MDDIFAAVIAAIGGGLLTWLVTTLPGVRRGRESRRQVANVILGIPEGPGIEERPSLVKRVSGLEEKIVEVGAHAKRQGDIAAKAAEALPRIEQEMLALTTSQAVLSRSMTDHSMVEETVGAQTRKDIAAKQAEMQQSIDGIHSALTEHAESDLRVSEEIRAIASQATAHADAARVAAQSAEAASVHNGDQISAVVSAVVPKSPGG